MSISVCWFEGIAGLDKYSAQFANEGIQGRSRYACCGLLNEAFDSYGDLFVHYSGWDGMPKVPEYAVVIVHGGHLRYQVEHINQKIAELQAVLVIGIGDEENDFPYHQLSHRNMKLWMQSPIPGKSVADRFPIVGYPVDCRELLVHDRQRDLDWSFAGQITHNRRHECVTALKALPNELWSKGFLLETKLFYSGMEHDLYFKMLSRTKIVPCPSGPVNSDTFRMAEALEAGCIPIVDEWPGWRDKPTTGIFDMIMPGKPFPTVQNWSELPQVMDRLLADYENKSREVQEYWKEYKRKYFSWLEEDLKALGAKI